ncbi:MAG: hypothetical protein ABI775_13145, partial [Pseudonocardiales bacterium]
MKYSDNAQLDTSGVQDARGGGLGGGRGIAVGGGGLGILGVVAYLVISLIGGNSGSKTVTDVLGQLGSGGGAQTADNAEVAKECRTGADANKNVDCAVVADIESIQNYWAAELPKLGKSYQPITT